MGETKRITIQNNLHIAYTLVAVNIIHYQKTLIL
jgi:hypothetical protein